VSRLLDLGAGKVNVIPNGVDAPGWRAEPRAVALARAEAGRYGWTSIAARTGAAYRHTIDNTPENRARSRARLATGRPTIVVPEGNLLALDGAAR
jgi:hypothetical protein